MLCELFHRFKKQWTSSINNVHKNEPYIQPWTGYEEVIAAIDKHINISVGAGTISRLKSVTAALKEFMKWDVCEVVGVTAHEIVIWCEGNLVNEQVVQKVLSYYKPAGVGFVFLREKFDDI